MNYTTDYFKQQGQRGGRTTARRGPDYYRELQKKSVEARKRKKQERSV